MASLHLRRLPTPQEVVPWWYIHLVGLSNLIGGGTLYGISVEIAKETFGLFRNFCDYEDLWITVKCL